MHDISIEIAPDMACWQNLGVDYLSIEAFQGRDGSVRRSLLSHGIVMLEGLNLSAVTPARYQLLALPVRIADAEAAPVALC